MVPSGPARQHGQLPRGLGYGQRVTVRLGQLASTVGRHPTELLFVEFDQQPGRQDVRLGQRQVLAIPADAMCVPGPDHQRKPRREAVVSAGMEVPHGTAEFDGQLHRAEQRPAAIPSIASRNRPTSTSPIGVPPSAVLPPMTGSRRLRLR
ncbi:hypothetical protein ACIQVO_22915 [Streptomyces sp. NPDC101062]|uniref:hypothetical protein n=1 Tax=unclassified Streptomyces TaxID=2593676 RepID=UPI0037FAA52A